MRAAYSLVFGLLAVGALVVALFWLRTANKSSNLSEGSSKQTTIWEGRNHYPEHDSHEDITEEATRPLKSLRDRILERKPYVRAAMDDLYRAWYETGYRDKLMSRVGQGIKQRAVGTAGDFIDEDPESPSDFMRTTVTFNENVWLDDASIIAFAEILEEEPDREKVAVCAEYFDLAAVEGRPWSQVLKQILTREGATAMVDFLRSTENDYASLVLVNVLCNQAQVTTNMLRVNGWQDDLPLDDSSAEKMLDWYEGHKTSLSPAFAIKAEQAILYSFRYSPKLLDFITREAFTPHRTNRRRFVEALCRSSEVCDDALPQAIQVLSDVDQHIRQSAVEILSRSNRVVDGASRLSGQVYVRLHSLWQSDPDPHVRKSALWGLASFDLADAFDAVKRYADSADDKQFDSLAGTVAENLRLRDRGGYRRIRNLIAERYSSTARDTGLSSERRASSYWVLYHVIRRRATEGEEAAAADFRDLIYEMMQMEEPAILNRISEILLDAKQAGLEP